MDLGVRVTAFGDHVLRQATRLRAAMEDARREVRRPCDRQGRSPPHRDRACDSAVSASGGLLETARRDAGHHAGHHRRVTLEHLAQQRWILSKSGSLLADWLEQRWREAGFPAPAPSVQVDSMATLLSIVAATDLVTFHSWSTIRHSPLRSALRPVAGSSLIWRRTLGATYRDGGYMPLAARRLIDLLVEIGEKERSTDRLS